MPILRSTRISKNGLTKTDLLRKEDETKSSFYLLFLWGMHLFDWIVVIVFIERGTDQIIFVF